MPIETVPGTSLKYYLIAFDADGKERTEADGKLSEKILTALAKPRITDTALAKPPITDVFIISHGWLGDIPAARDQYNDWIGAMAKQTADLETLERVRPGFNPLLIGIHWPSKPWGDEDLGGGGLSFAVTDESASDRLVNEYAERIADTEAARSALQTIFNAAMENQAPDNLPPEVIAAYQVLNQESQLSNEGETGAPGSDWEGFDPEAIYQSSQSEPVSFDTNSSSVLDKILDPLRVLSYWKMKDRARKIGEGAGFNLLKTLQENAAATVRFHLIGHSFGCIVVSATVGGPKGQGKLVRPVNTIFLAQGAVSLWSYCGKIAYEKNRPGYFNQIVAQGKVSGAIVTTRSVYDYAVGRVYPLAGKIVFSSVDFAANQLPKYGGIGSFGIGGNDLGAEDLNMLASDGKYEFKSRKIYNLEGSDFINNVEMGGPTSGAHCDIAKPEVAHAVWSAVAVS